MKRSLVEEQLKTIPDEVPVYYEPESPKESYLGSIAQDRRYFHRRRHHQA